MTPITSRPERACVRCGLIARLDRCGYCVFCQHEASGEGVWWFITQRTPLNLPAQTMRGGWRVQRTGLEVQA